MTESEKPRTTRPALEVLDRDQDRLLYEGDARRDPPIVPLSKGFATYWEALVWYQAAGVRTLGHVEDVLPPEAMLPLSGVLANPTAPPANPQRFVLPTFVGGLELAFVLLGHLLAIWVAHSVAYDTFPSRLQAVRSQYPFIGAMVVYTMVSLWIVAAPSLTPPYL